MIQIVRIDTDYVFYKSFKQSVSEGFTQSETFTYLVVICFQIVSLTH